MTELGLYYIHSSIIVINADSEPSCSEPHFVASQKTDSPDRLDILRAIRLIYVNSEMKRCYRPRLVSLLVTATWFCLVLTDSVSYAPGDTRLLNSQALFCQALTVAYSTPVNISSSALYVLEAEPTLTTLDRFAFIQSETLNNSRKFYSWNLHFYAGSQISFSACINGSGSAVNYVIKGWSKFRHNDWNKSAVNSFKINSTCPNRHAYSFKVTEENQYFLVFRKSESEDQPVSVLIEISFRRTGYKVENDVQIFDRDSFNANDSGRVHLPLGSSSHILLVYGNSSELPENWSSISPHLTTDVTCEPRIWVYAVIAVGAALVLLLCIACVVCCTCLVCHSKKRKLSERNPLLRDWDDVDTDIHSYHPYKERRNKLDNLTELAIAAPDASNPHIAQFKEDIKSPSFQDDYLSNASPKFSTFKP